MELFHFYSLLENSHSTLPCALKVQKSLSLTQAQLTLLIGRSLKFSSSTRPLKEYLGFLDMLESLEIHGLPKEASIISTRQFIDSYLQTLADLTTPTSTPKIKDLIFKKLASNIQEKSDSYLLDLFTNYKFPEKSHSLGILSSWSKLTFPKKTSKYLFEKSTEAYLISYRISLKYEKIHLAAYGLFIAALKSSPDLFVKKREKVSVLFQKAQAVCRKYIQHKTNKEALYLMCCEFILLCLSDESVVEGGLKDVVFPAIFGKTCYVESFMSYFFKQTYVVMKRANITTKMLLGCKEYLLRYLMKNQQFIAPALNSFNDYLKAVEEPELIATIIKIISELCRISDESIKKHVFVPYLLVCSKKLPMKISSDLLNLTISLLPEQLIKPLDSLFSLNFNRIDTDMIIWVKKVAKGLPSGPKVVEIIKGLAIIYKNSYKDESIASEIIKALSSLSEVFAEKVIEIVINTVAEMLISHEKLLWIKNESEDLNILISKSFNLMNIAKICVNKSSKLPDSQKMNEFWSIITHFTIQYDLNEEISKIEFHENLKAISKVTPALLTPEQKDPPLIFLTLFQTTQYSKVFLPKLKAFLSAYCHKKYPIFRTLDNCDYSILLTAASIHKYLSTIPESSILTECLYYLSLELSSYQSLISDFVGRIILDHWKEFVRAKECPVKDVILLFKASLSQHLPVRSIAMKLLHNSPNSASVCFPSIFYSKDALICALDIYGALALESRNEYSSSIPLLYLPHSKESLPLPCSKLVIAEMHRFFESFIHETLSKSLCQSPRQVLSAFAFFIFTSNKLTRSSTNLTAASAVNAGISMFNQHYYSSKQIDIFKFGLIESYLYPERFHNWFRQQKSSEGFALRDESMVQLQENYLSIADSLRASGVKINELLVELRESVKETSMQVFDVMGKTTAMIVIEESAVFYDELVQVPLSNGGLSSIKAAVFCWEWLSSMLPELKLSLFFEISLRWKLFLSTHGLSTSPPPYSASDLLSLHPKPSPSDPENLSAILEVLNFIQTQIYSSINSAKSIKHLLNIITYTFHHRLNPYTLSCEPGIEIVLKLILIITELSQHLPTENYNKLFLQLTDFCLSGFVDSHKWVKASSLTNFGEIKAMFEKGIEAMSKYKYDEEIKRGQGNGGVSENFDWEKHEEVLVYYAVELKGESASVRVEDKREILLMFLYNEYQKFLAWNSSMSQKGIQCPKHKKHSKLAKVAFKLSPGLGRAFNKLSNAQKSYEKNLGSNEEEQKYLFRAYSDIPLAINSLDSNNPCERSYYIKLFTRSSEKCKLYYMQQVLECGYPRSAYKDYKRLSGEEDVWTYLTKSAMSSAVFLNQLVWMLEVSLFNPGHDLSETLGYNFYHIILEIIKNDPEEWEQFTKEASFFEKFLLISASLTPKDPENFNKINKGLIELSDSIPSGLYIPTDPSHQLVGLRNDNGRPLQSAKRTPIMVTFYTKTCDSDLPSPTQCIFKVNDDVRNDQLCLQVIELMQEILHSTGLKIYLRPYKVISAITHTNEGDQLSGIIECIPNCKSRDEIGKEGTDSLHTYFLDKFGDESSQSYIEAKNNFISSLAGYAVASYVLQIKDRHNGNILIDEFGHIIHIDFGFILKISPGGNMRFERPGFKLTQEMVDVIGKNDSESFEYFKSLVVKGYLAIREYAGSFIAIVKRMQDSGLTCFRKGAVNDFIKRFYMNLSLTDAIKKMNEKILRSNNSFFTLWYDRIQLMQQQIEY